jgi:hypothetical protein
MRNTLPPLYRIGCNETEHEFGEDTKIVTFFLLNAFFVFRRAGIVCAAAETIQNTTLFNYARLKYFATLLAFKCTEKIIFFASTHNSYLQTAFKQIFRSSERFYLKTIRLVKKATCPERLPLPGFQVSAPRAKFPWRRHLPATLVDQQHPLRTRVLAKEICKL